MDLFIGRFHPLLVHLPIGFLLLAFVLEALARFRKLPESVDRVISVTYLVSFLAAAGAVISGWLLSENGAYSPDALATHKWLGISVMALSLILFGLRYKAQNINPRYSFGLSVALVIIVSATGHYGGILTHGDDYLYEYAPAWVQSVAGYHNPADEKFLAEMSPDSVLIYTHLVRPVLVVKCMRCHEEGNAAGGFNAASYATLFREGEEGTPVIPGSLQGSELFRRITLPTSSRKFMPPNGHPLSFSEVQILRYWIEQGADSLARFEFETMTPELVALMQRDYRLDFTLRPFYEKLAADSLPAELLQRLEAEGFRAERLAEGNFFLDVKYTGDTLAGLNALEEVEKNIVFLDLSGVVLSGSDYPEIARFKYLARLNLAGSSFPGGLMDALVPLEYLEVLNVYNTSVTEDELAKVLEAPALKRVYLWQTSISDSVVQTWKTEYPELQFDAGASLQVVKADSTASE